MCPAADREATPPALLGTAPELAARGPPSPILVVAIGASAGGLEAASTLLDCLPARTGMAFIVVQHLDPTHESMMVELLANHTTMTAVEATDGSPLEPDQIHVIPPGRYLSVRAGSIHLSPTQNRHGARLPFDVLLDSLAGSCGMRTICVVLSGTGADGSGGIRALKRAGGFVIVQLPEQADYDGMPRSALATGLVDRTLPLRDIPQALVDRASQIAGTDIQCDAKGGPAPSTGLGEIISFLNDRTSHDFRQYKIGTLERRIERRIALLSLQRGNFYAYLDVLHNDPGERDLLARDLLINVTSFFRDPPVFEALATTIVPDLIGRLTEHQPLRVWVAGCSTGEEAYSIAMICRDAIESSGRNIRLQVFASDADADAIATAREGQYPLDIAAHIKVDRLARYFVKDDAGYRVTTMLRGDVVFTVHDVLSDPPFSDIALLSCRNMLIYLNPDAQARVIALFHFALREGGILILGLSETVGKAEGKFETIAKAERFYRHTARGRPGDADFPISFRSPLAALGKVNRTPTSTNQSDLAEVCRRAVLASHAPAAILINHKRKHLYSMGPTERYLRVAPGYASLDLLAMATPALRTKLRLAIDKASSTVPRVDGGRSRSTFNGATIWFGIDVHWLSSDDEGMLLVCFVEEARRQARAASKTSRIDAARIAELEHELEVTQAELQASILNQETSSQEQQAINEEALSVNEEFQSTNEELLTSKEELQCLNEELTALNSQLQETLRTQRLTSNDLQNVLYSTNVATLFLDTELKIRFYTPATKWLFGIIPGDIGRPLADLQPIANDPDLLADARQALADKTSMQREVSAPGEVWFMRRIFPYRDDENRVEGVVIAFADITERKVTEKALEVAKVEAERASLAKSRFLAAASHDLRQPLQSLTLIRELLVRSIEGEKPQKLLGRLEQTLEAMSGMLNALLDINQIETGAVEAKIVTFAISELLDRLRSEFTHLAQARNLSLKIMASRTLVDSDPHLLEQMIRNLLGNAIKYTKRGKVLLGCKRRGDTLRIEVWDTGIGIPADQLNAIFDEFHQIGNAARDRSLGLGLGLSIVQRLGALLGHDVDVRSVPGRGSVFTITLANQAQKLREPSAIIIGTNTDSVSTTCHFKIAIVEDDPDILEMLEQILTQNGHIVSVAPDAASALNLITGSAIRPEILLTDYNLQGGMNGLELLAQLRASLDDALPAIIMTGDISTDTLAKINSHNCVQLNKPVRARELAAAIERLRVESSSFGSERKGLPTTPRASVVYVVDDDPDVRSIVRHVLEGDGRTVRDFSSAEAFLEVYRSGEVACLLVDAYLPRMSGVSLLNELRAGGDHLPVVLITGSGDVGLAVTAMRSGACDFIEKPVGGTELLASITRAIDQSHDTQLIDAAHEAAAARVADLTLRQREVMDMVLAGYPSKNIAADLGISQRTVENHRAAIMQKMEAKSLPELARKAQAAAVYDHPTETDRMRGSAPRGP